MSVIHELHDRGFIKDRTFDLGITDPIRAYIGFDLTAPSLHVGSLIQLMVLRHLLRCGHTPFVLLGEATTRIGDPSGKDTARPMLDDATIEENRVGITQVIDRVVSSVSPTRPLRHVSNMEWFGDGAYPMLHFMTQYGPHFTINRMLTMDSVQTRLSRQQPLTLLEFSYMLFQAVDFLELKRQYGVTMQIGGSDQWGNIINGVDLIRRLDGDEVMAFTTPLLLDAQGNKMGKSQGQPIWLDPEMTSPFDFFQYWRNCADEDVERFYKLFTEVSLSSINAMFRPRVGEPKSINVIKKALAYDITTIVHGKAAAQKALDESIAIFETRDITATARSVVARMDETIASYLVSAGLAPSKGAAKRLVAGNGVTINGKQVVDPLAPIPREGVIRVGKQAPVKIVGE